MIGRHDTLPHPRSLLVLMGALICCALWSAAAPGQQVRFRCYKQADGLINLSVPCLLRGRSGDLWVCAENGVERFDGIRFERIGQESGLTSSRFYAIAEDDAGSVWLGATTELFAGSGRHFKPARYLGHALPIGIGSQLAPLPGQRMLILIGGQLYVADASKGGHTASAFAIRPFRLPAILRVLQRSFFAERPTSS